MRTCFADTYYFIALLVEDDEAHAEAVRFSKEYKGHILTTEWVITELGDALAGARSRQKFLNFLSFLRANPKVQIVKSESDLFSQGTELYAKRPDKEWSVTDCISFVVMKDQDLSDAITGDHHFGQAGFTTLLQCRRDAN